MGRSGPRWLRSGAAELRALCSASRRPRPNGPPSHPTAPAPAPAPQVGLRVMHRTTVQGQFVPRKAGDPRFQQHPLAAAADGGGGGRAAAASAAAQGCCGA